MDLEKVKIVLEKVKRAANEQIPTGVVLVWSHLDGTNLSWTELKEALEFLVGTPAPASNPPATSESSDSTSGKKKE